MKNSLYRFLLTLLGGGLLLLLWRFELPPLYDISLRFDDLNFDLHDKKPDDSILFIAIDERSVNTLGRWPWDRKVVAQGVSHLGAAKVVLFDMVFSEPTNQTSDETLGEAISGINSVCGFFLRHKATQDLSQDQKDQLLDSASEDLAGQDFPFIHADFVEANIPEVFNNCSLQASFSTIRESDSLFRNYPLAFTYNGSYYPSLGLQALRFSFDKPLQKHDSKSILFNDKLIPFNDKGFTRLNYYPLDSYKMVSFLDLYEGKVAPELLKDKIVILGITEAGVEDVRATPIGAVPGPLLHYTFLSNYLQDDLLFPADKTVISVALIFLILPFILIFFIKKILYRVLLYIVTLVLFFFISKMMYMHAHLWVETFYPALLLIVSALLNEVFAFTTQEKEAKFIQGAFSSYLSPMLLNKLKEHPELLQLGGETKEMTIFFSDIRSFTNISESMTPETLVKLLNRYFTPMAHIVRNNEGMLDKYIGDAIMAFFNAPIDVEDHAKKACKAALEMIEYLEVLNKELVLEGIDPIAIGIGLNTAEVTVGNMGSDDRFNYTVIGDGVNLASRVEGLTKNYHTQILITENTFAQLDDTFLCRRLEAVKVKGKDEAVILYELMFNTPENREIKEAFETVLLQYEAHDFEASKEGFKNVHERYQDNISALFYEKSIENAIRLKNHEDVSAVKMTTK